MLTKCYFCNQQVSGAAPPGAPVLTAGVLGTLRENQRAFYRKTNDLFIGKRWSFKLMMGFALKNDDFALQMSDFCTKNE